MALSLEDSSSAWVFCLPPSPDTPLFTEAYRHWLVLALKAELLGLGLEPPSFLPQFPPWTDGPRVSRTCLLSCWMLTVDNSGSSGDPGKVPGGGTVHSWLALQAPGIVSRTDNLGVWERSQPVPHGTRQVISRVWEILEHPACVFTPGTCVCG